MPLLDAYKVADKTGFGRGIMDAPSLGAPSLAGSFGDGVNPFGVDGRGKKGPRVPSLLEAYGCAEPSHVPNA